MKKKTPNHALVDQPWFKWVYKIGIGLKGFDGLLELMGGLLLLIFPQTVQHILLSASTAASTHDGTVYALIAKYSDQYSQDLANSGALFLIIFLISHGVVKIALVYALLKEITKAYPYALGILVAFLFYQIYVLILHAGPGMALLTILDIVIIWLVWLEYGELKSKFQPAETS